MSQFTSAPHLLENQNNDSFGVDLTRPSPGRIVKLVPLTEAPFK